MQPFLRFTSCRYNVPRITHSIRNKSDTISSKDQSTVLETEDDDQPIRYSTSKAASMRIDEYRDPIGDIYPWYQGYIISACLTVFLVYFCILREENDIDLLLYTDLQETLNNVHKEMEKKQKELVENARLKSK